MGRQLACERLGGIARIGAVAIGCLVLAHCSGPLARRDPQYSPRVVEEGEPVPKGGGAYRVGRPYNVNGRTYVPTENPGYRAEGIASWYGPDFHGRLTANGEVYDMHSITAAHTTMPLPSYARVTNLDNGRSMIVRVNDRGPYAHNRIIDVSIGAAKALDFYGHGLARVRVEYVGRAPLEGSDDRMLMATLREGGQVAPAPSRVMVASSSSFVPDFGEGGPPLPPERPFALGGQARSATFESVSEAPARSAAKPRPRTSGLGGPSSALEAWAQAPEAGPPSVVSTLNGGGGSGLGLMSGRGLY
jgi:rare lipoprotein A